ncbi:MAG: O-antigen ligase family protein [Candidatus Liptonbacteria bacterium]|nr:O-antigen ligase family protein [Candidatus Liptonbacteria bacterium]
MAVKYLFYIFLASLPFGYRTTLYQFTAGFDEYEGVFLYASDVLMVALLVAVWWRYYTQIAKHTPRWSFGEVGKSQTVSSWKSELPNIARRFLEFGLLKIWLLLFLFFSSLSIFWAPIPLLALYNLGRLLLLALLCLAVSKLITYRLINLQTIFGFLATLAVFESLIGFFQFLFQQSLGLWFLGESILGPWVIGTAKFFIEGGSLVRAYGTFPHPNILGAFLLLGLASLYYFWLTRPSEKKIWAGLPVLQSDLLFGLTIFIVLSGIIFTFSRATWLIAIFLSLFTIGYSLLARERWIQAVRLFFLLLATAYILLTTFSPLIFPRAQISISEPAVSYRMSYNKIGSELIKANPMGVGIGNQVIYSIKNDVYKNAGLTQVWEWQPIHNLYLLIASEVGILGLLSLLGFLGTVMLCKIKNQKSKIKNTIQNVKLENGAAPTSDVLNIDAPIFFGHRISRHWTFDCEPAHFIPKIMLISLLIFGMFDHFLWTLEPGRLMLWVTVGMVMGSSIVINEGKYA